MTEALTETPPDVGTVRTEIGVGTADLRQALRSVVVHASGDKDDPLLSRVRLIVQRDNVLVCATNRYTIAAAAVSIWHNEYADDGVIVDLTPTQVAEILAVFRSKGDKRDDEGDDDLRVRVTDRYLVITDTAGLFPGKEVTWPRLEPDRQFPNIGTVLAGILLHAGTGRPAALHTSGKLLALFGVASSVYDAPVVIEPTKDSAGALCLTIGESFVGALMPRKPSDEDLERHRAWRESWHTRLGLLA